MNAPALPPRHTGFTLIELIAVISIIVIILALLVPAFNTLARGSNLTNAAASVLDELNLARQTALTRNRVVEVRFYLLPAEIGSAPAYRAMRSFLANETGDSLSPIAGVKRFPISVVALNDATFSTLLSDTTRTQKTSEVEDLPGAPSTRFKSIRFRPSGGVELSSYTTTNDNWFLTIKNENDPIYPDRPADNFATIQVDPTTGRAQQMRP